MKNTNAAPKNELWHVRYVTSNRGRVEYYGVFCESHRNVSGTSISKHKTREAAQVICDAHNKGVGARKPLRLTVKTTVWDSVNCYHGGRRIKSCGDMFDMKWWLTTVLTRRPDTIVRFK